MPQAQDSRPDLDAIQAVLAAHRSKEAHITGEQVTAAWAALDALRREDNEQAQRLVEIGRCAHSLSGGLEAIADGLPEGSLQAAELAGVIDGGLPALVELVMDAIADAGAELPDERREKSMARGYQSMILLRCETAGEEVPRAAWAEDPVAFMKRLRAEGDAALEHAICNAKLPHDEDPDAFHWCRQPKGHDGPHGCDVCHAVWCDGDPAQPVVTEPGSSRSGESTEVPAPAHNDHPGHKESDHG